MTLNLANDYEIVKYFNLTYYENPLEKRNLSPELKEMLGIINNPSKEYQSILTIPFYHCGSEDYNYTIDPDDQFATTSMQLSYFSKLPLMSSKMGRTSIIQTKNLFNIYLNKTIPLEILSNFNSKKILVFVDRGFYNGKKTWPFNDKEPASTVIKTSIELLDSTNCNKIYSVNDLELYEMTINN